MTVNSQRLLLAAAGAAAAGEALYVDDVFSTYLWTGDATATTITNDIDVSGEGGLVWIKNRTDAAFHYLFDTERGASKVIYSQSTAGEGNTSIFSSFNSDGFSVASSLSENNKEYVSWTFRKTPGFFDVVTYTGDGTNPRSIAHSLGSKPGFFIVKRLDAAGSFWCYHHSRTNSKVLELNTTAAEETFSYWPSEPTSTHFTVSASPSLNGSGNTYVCYLFAHDDQSFGTDEDEAIIKCGSYTGSTTVDLGFEPQWLLIKRTDASAVWGMFDVMRGIVTPGGDDELLKADSSDAESSSNYGIDLTPTGFSTSATFGTSGGTYVYVAIRRPHKPPEAGTDVFAVESLGATSPSPPGWTSGFPVDWIFRKTVNTGNNWTSIARLTMTELLLNRDYVESGANTSDEMFDSNTGYFNSSGTNTNNYSWMFRRGPGFFDVVTYIGNGTAGRTVAHNLASTPEFIIARNRSIVEDWTCYHSTPGATKYIQLNGTSGEQTLSTIWNNTAPTSTNFTVGTQNRVNGNTYNYVAYLFATLDGISKVGSYTGTGSNIGVDCGFTAGARFVLIKRTDSTGDWYVYDSTRGIVGGNDPYLLINSTAAEVTNTDYIDPLNSGFTVTSSAPAALNASGGTYIFLAIA